jgi:hypothetical protein
MRFISSIIILLILASTASAVNFGFKYEEINSEIQQQEQVKRDVGDFNMQGIDGYENVETNEAITDSATDAIAGIGTAAKNVVETLENVAGTPATNSSSKTVQTPYFGGLESSYLDWECKSENFKCPTLVGDYLGLYRTRVDAIDPKSGTIVCSILPLKHPQDITKDNYYEVVETRTFAIKACADDMSYTNNSDIAEIQQKTVEYYDGIANEIKLSEKAYLQDAKATGTDIYLDTADWLDALATIDPDVIDIENTVKSGEVRLNDGYTIIPNLYTVVETAGEMEKLGSFIADTGSTVVNGAKKIINSAASLFGKDGDLLEVNEVNWQDNFKMKSELISKQESIANSKYVMYVEFFTKSNKTISDIAFWLFIFFLLWQIIHAGIDIGGSAMTKRQSQESYLMRGIVGVFATFTFFGGMGGSVYYQDEFKNNVEIQTNRIQSAIRWGYEITNDYADELAQIAIKSYMNSLAKDAGFSTIDQLKTLTAEKNIAQKENAMLTDIYNKECVAKYDIQKSARLLAEYRRSPEVIQNGLIKYSEEPNAAGVVESQNPFPVSESEANLVFFKVGKSPYDTKALATSGFDGSNYQALSSCYNINRQVQLNNQKYQDSVAKLATLENTDGKDKKKEFLLAVNDMMWKSYLERGYIAIAYLPAAGMIIEALTNFDEENKKVNADEELSLYEEVVHKLVVLTLFNGSGVAQMINDTSEAITGVFGGVFNKFAPTNMLTVGISTVAEKTSKVLDLFSGTKTVNGERVSKPGIISYVVASYMIDNVLQNLGVIALVASTIFAFIILALQKLWVYTATLFIVIFAFAKQQEDRMGEALGKIIIVAFKAVLLVVSTFLAIYALSLVDTLGSSLTHEFYGMIGTVAEKSRDTMDISLDFFLSYVDEILSSGAFVGLMYIILEVVKIALALLIVFKLPSYFIDLIGSHTRDIGDDIIDTIKGGIEQRATRV